MVNSLLTCFGPLTSNAGHALFTDKEKSLPKGGVLERKKINTEFLNCDCGVNSNA